jgi:hypothetical protein
MGRTGERLGRPAPGVPAQVTFPDAECSRRDIVARPAARDEAHDLTVRDVIVTVVVAAVLALIFMYLLLSLVFAGWGDRLPPASPPATSGKALWTVVDAA